MILNYQFFIHWFYFILKLEDSQKEFLSNKKEKTHIRIPTAMSEFCAKSLSHASGFQFYYNILIHVKM